ncbi:putative reverse transcriptase domain-containing protein [Tanacetum coccineum]|uniref:Reverse transcriptase domain-containing protein n=1 Tax=Tanacetum coccineum TaxID=301880 RepID=A0ABQ5GUP8_9ASTR
MWVYPTSQPVTSETYFLKEDFEILAWISAVTTAMEPFSGFLIEFFLIFVFYTGMMFKGENGSWCEFRSAAAGILDVTSRTYVGHIPFNEYVQHFEDSLQITGNLESADVCWVRYRCQKGYEKVYQRTGVHLLGKIRRLFPRVQRPKLLYSRTRQSDLKDYGKAEQRAREENERLRLQEQFIPIEKNTSIGVRDAGFGRGTQANEGQDIKNLKENVHAIQVGCQTCGGPHLDKECPLNEEVKSIEELKYSEFGRSSPFNNGAKYRLGLPGYYTHLGASISVRPKSMFKHLKLANRKKTSMLVEMADMRKRAPIGIVENILVKIDNFLFPLDFMVIDMLNTCNETMILGRPFLATIHAEIDVFNKEISLGIGDDKVTFDMDKKIHYFTTLVEKVYMVNSIHYDESSTSSNASSDKSPQFEKSNNLHHKNNNDNYMQERSSKKARMLKPDTNTPSAHFCKPGVLKYRYCYLDGDRKSIKEGALSFPDFLLVRYGDTQGSNLIWDTRFSQQGNGIRGHINSYSCGKNVSVWAGYEFAQDTLVKSSAFAIIIWSIEQCLGESLVLILLLSLNFIS